MALKGGEKHPGYGIKL